jgi:hypothetical protein
MIRLFIHIVYISQKRASTCLRFESGWWPWPSIHDLNDPGNISLQSRFSSWGIVISPEDVKKRPWLTNSAFLWSPDSSYGMACESIFWVPVHDGGSRSESGKKYRSVLTWLWHMQKDVCQGTYWKLALELWAISLSEFRHCKINHRSWTFEATLSLSPWTSQNHGRDSLVPFWSFCFPILSDGNIGYPT